MKWLEADEANQKFFEEAKQVWTLTAPVAEDFTEGKQAAWQRIALAVEEAPKPKPRMLSLFSWRWKAAAAVFIVLAAALWYFHRGDAPAQVLVFTSGEGETLELLLPDSSTVALNENSRLEYASDFTTRVVTLSGEAFFEVTQQSGAHFTVVTGDVRTTVLGTAFNVRAYPQEHEVEVAVEHGKVAVAFDEAVSAERAVLQAGEAVRVFDEEKKMEKVHNPNALAWRKGVLSFDDHLMSQIVATLERYFDREIFVQDSALLQCHYTATFAKPNLNEVLDVLANTLGFEVEIRGDSIVLKGQGCH